MTLADLIYRCPFCGTDTSQTPGGEALCPGCERSFARGDEGGTIRVRQGSGDATEFGVGLLIDRMRDCESDASVLEASVVARFALRESPVHYRGSLIGLYEERGPRKPGRLRLDNEDVQFIEPTGAARKWPLRDLRAVQTASAAVQISPPGGGLVSFRILDDSPRRWEETLKERLRSVWLAEGRGEILEFQPRIRTRS